MVSLIVCAALLAQGQTPARVDLSVTLKHPETGQPSSMYVVRGARLDEPKRSPKRFPPGNQRWAFDWVTSAYGRKPDGRFELRFRIFSQQREEGYRDPGQLTARMGLRMWEMLRGRLRGDHAMLAKDLRLIDVYLATGGTAGGEQLFAEDDEGGVRKRVNTIYIYDLKSFAEPLEMAREFAHEYGHAVLPPVGGFQAPEDWANGYFGEKLFLGWFRDGLAKGQLVPEDVMGVQREDLDAWVKTNVDPLILRAATTPPDLKRLGGKGQSAMDAYMGLALYAGAILPPEVFGRSLYVTGSTKATDYPNALVLACAERDFSMVIPPLLSGKAIWLPLGNGRIEGAKVLTKKGSWAKVQPLMSNVRFLAPAESKKAS